jgi:tetratricopeptide (TPR) repeat protein
VAPYCKIRPYETDLKLMNIILIAIFVLTVLGVIGYLSSINQKKKAPIKLIEAEQLFQEEKLNESLLLLKEAFYTPFNEKYSAEDAQHISRVIVLLEAILTKSNINPSPLTEQYLRELEKASKSTKLYEIEDKISNRVEKFFNKLEDEAQVAGELIKQIQNRGLSVIEEDEENKEQNSLNTAESAIVNKIGNLVLSGKIDEGIQLASSVLENETLSDELKNSILNQRGGLYFMKRDFESAAKDYAEVLCYKPNDSTSLINLAETYEQAGRKTLALETAQKVLQLPDADRDSVKTAKEIINRPSCI